MVRRPPPPVATSGLPPFILDAGHNNVTNENLLHAYDTFRTTLTVSKIDACQI